MKMLIYLYKKFIPVFLGSLAFFCMILSITDLFINLWSYIAREVPLEIVGKIMLYFLPKTIWYSVPIAVLFAVAYTLSDLYAKNELTAIFASGISLLKFTMPLLIFSVIASFGLFFFDDFVVVPTYAKKQSIQKEALHKETSTNNDRIVIMSEEGRVIYKADFYDDAQKRLYGITIVFRDKDKSFQSIIRSDNALFHDGKWVLNNAIQYTRQDSTLVQTEVDKQFLDRLTEEPDTFRNNVVDIEEVSTREARQYIRHLEKAGLPCSEAKSVYYKKFAFPFVVFIVVFLAIGLSGKTRKNVLIISLALSIGAVVLFYVLQMITMLMAKFGAIPPLFGSAFPILFFTVLSVILLRYART